MSLTIQDELRAVLIGRRDELGMTQRQLAAKMRSQQSTVSYLESGQIRQPRVETLERWAAALCCRIDMTITMEPIPEGE